MGKKAILFYMTSLGGLWIIGRLLPGVSLPSSGIFVILLVTLAITGGIIINEMIEEKMSKKSIPVYMIIGTLINFFTIYIANLLIPTFRVSAGSFNRIPLLENLGTGDQILTLLVASFISILFAVITKTVVKK